MLYLLKCKKSASILVLEGPKELDLEELIRWFDMKFGRRPSNELADIFGIEDNKTNRIIALGLWLNRYYGFEEPKESKILELEGY